jgi:hypothetical protein
MGSSNCFNEADAIKFVKIKRIFAIQLKGFFEN